MNGAAVQYFDVWQAGYAGASVAIYAAGTSTLLPVFYDQALTQPALNPQVLMSMSQNGQNFGKFGLPIYVGAAYEIAINGTNRTAVVHPPLVTLDDEDASAALVTPTGGSVASSLADLMARVIDVLDQGEFLPTSNPGASAATNTVTLAAAIGVAAAAGGGTVITPPGVFAFTQIQIPARVLLQGAGRDVTTLQSNVAAAVVTFSGDTAGLKDITIDGLILGANSVGVFSKALNETRFNNVNVARFETGIHYQGGHRANWREVYADNCAVGVVLAGDSALSAGGAGSDFKFNQWDGGRVTNCTEVGAAIGFIDLPCWHNKISHVGFENNPAAIGFQVKGARFTDMPGCWWSNNLVDLNVVDGDDSTKIAQNSVIGLHITDFVINDDMNFAGTCQDVVFERGEFAAGTYTLTTVQNSIITRDCTETNSVALAGGNAEQWMRTRTELGDWPGSTGVTTGAAATVAWAYQLAPGENVFLEAKVIASGRNVNDYAVFQIAQGAQRPGSALAYDTRTATFTPGSILTGHTSGATAQITNDTNGAGIGTLTLTGITGAFVNNETITDAAGGSALANGILVPANAVLLGAITSISAAVKSDAAWACIFTVQAGEVCVTVTGAALKTVEWTPSVQVTSG